MRVVAVVLCMALGLPAAAETRLIVSGGGHDTSGTVANTSGHELGYSLRYIDRSQFVFYALTNYARSKTSGVTSKDRQSTIGLGYALRNTLDEAAGQGQRLVLGVSGGALRAERSGTAHVTTYRTLFSNLEAAVAPRHLLTATAEATWDSRNSDPTISVTTTYEMPVAPRVTFEPSLFASNNNRSDLLGLTLGAGFEVGNGMELKAGVSRARLTSGNTTGTQNGWHLGLELNF